jgi:hypothetical protein
MTKRKSRLAGYRLHRERILFSGGQVIRTIKFPLAPLNPSEETALFLKDFERTTIADDLKIRGDLNINDYLAYTAEGKPLYTLFDFWVDSLRAGVIWMPKGTKLIDFLASQYNTTSPFDRIWEKASPRITSIFKKDKFKGIFLSDPIRNTSTKNSFYKRILESLKDDLVKENIIISTDAKKEVELIVNSFFNDDGKLILDGESQFNFWEKEYNLDKDIIESAKPKGRYADITFVIIPELICDLNTKQSLDNLINKREAWLSDKKLLSSILGLSDNFNGFSNYLGVVLRGLQEEDGDKEALYEAQKTIFPRLENYRNKVLESLDFLSQKAKLLGETSLPLVNGWHDYRSAFGGKLQSWFTNFQKRKEELDGQISQFKENLFKAKNYLQKENFGEESDKEKEDILSFLSLLENFFTDEQKSIKIEENYQLFEPLLALIKRRLNFFYQKYIQKEGDETKVNKFKEFEGLYKTIYKPVAFYGYSAKRANEKFVNKTTPILEDGIENIKRLISYLQDSFSVQKTFEDIKQEKEEIDDPYRKFLQFFWNKYVDASINSPLFLEKYEEIIKENIEDNKWKEISDKNKKGRYVFYKSPYAKGTLEKIPIKANSYLDKLQVSVLELAEFILSFKKDTLLFDSALLLDWIELSKNIISLLLKFNTKEAYKFDGLLLENFSQAKKYQELFKREDYPKNEFSFIIQSLVLSETRGAATLYSKKEYIASYSVQVVGADGRYKLYYIPKEEIPITTDTIKSKPESIGRRQLMKPHCFAVALNKVLEKKKNQNFNAILLSKSNITAVFLPDESLQKLFKLSSSPYQLQFLDKYLYRPAGWENIDISLGEWSFVVEKKYQINWDLQSKKPKLLPITDSEQAKENKIYLAIPFNLSPNNQIKQSAPLKSIAKGNEKIEKDLSRLNYPILGVDVGEYGLAYCLIKFDFDKNTYKITGIKLGSDEKETFGFIEDKNIGNIKDKFSEIQQKARQGAFDEEDTIVARVRENAIGHLRNRIHIVVTQEKSSSVYEDSITNFETGSGRTTKIYNSVKRADTESGTDADKQIHNHIWGDKTKWVGRNVSAYASSYTCVNCLKSLYQIKKEDLAKMIIIQKDGRVVIISSPYGDMKGYVSKEEKYDVGYQFRGTDEDLKKLRKIVQDFARPPVSNRSEVLEKYAKPILETGRVEEWRKRRGNSSIFVCPFCQYVADADIQAAFMMAVRGYLRFSGIVPSQSNKKKQDQEEEKTAGESFLEQTQKQLKNIDRSRIKNAFLLKI